MSKKLTKSTNSPSQTKADKIIALLHRRAGASIAELVKATGWQRHSIHSFMSGKLKKKQSLPIASSKTDKGDRRYFIADKAQ